MLLLGHEASHITGGRQGSGGGHPAPLGGLWSFLTEARARPLGRSPGVGPLSLGPWSCSQPHGSACLESVATTTGACVPKSLTVGPHTSRILPFVPETLPACPCSQGARAWIYGSRHPQKQLSAVTMRPQLPHRLGGAALRCGLQCPRGALHVAQSGPLLTVPHPALFLPRPLIELL